jgi:pimeloyl-ACP methyl ester carboxylesterase
MGWSSGSEAALLLGVRYPDLVHGVAAFSFDDVASCNGFGQGSPTWTYGGRPVPCTNQSDNPHPTDNPAAVIPVAKIHGPMFLGCGEHDSWSSCYSYAKAIMAALAAAHDSYRHEFLEYPDAGHGIGTLLPYYPGIAVYEEGLGPPGFPAGFIGTSAVANPLARAIQWPKLLAFLRN